jgi:glycerophosphoryl diester phosphodiesterase
VPWTFERSGPLANVSAEGEYYYAQIAQGIHSDGQMFEVLDVLARQVLIKANIIFFFLDWSATATYYANCFGLQYGNKCENL